jgi:hypothetical protein
MSSRGTNPDTISISAPGSNPDAEAEGLRPARGAEPATISMLACDTVPGTIFIALFVSEPVDV